MAVRPKEIADDPANAVAMLMAGLVIVFVTVAAIMMVLVRIVLVMDMICVRDVSSPPARNVASELACKRESVAAALSRSVFFETCR